MKKSKNIIQKLEVEVEANSMETGLSIKDNINGFLEENVLKELDQIIEEIIGREQWYRWDEISIELNLDSWNDLESVRTNFEAAFKRQIEGKIKESLPSKQQDVPQSIASDAWNTLSYFLTHGYLPWWTGSDFTFRIEDFGLPMSSVSVEKMKATLQEAASLKRLTYQFDNDFIRFVYISCFIKGSSEISEPTIPTLLRENNYLREILWQASFQYQLQQNNKNLTEILQGILRNPDVSSRELRELVEFIQTGKEIPIGLSTENTEISFVVFETLKNAKNSTEKAVFEPLKTTPVKISEEKIKETENVLTNEAEIKTAPDSSNMESKLSPEGQLVNQAGLILLHPFLKHFLKKMELLEDNSIKPEQLDKAIHLLHYLATKTVHPPESELLMEKFLCNVPFSYVVRKHFDLTDADKRACEELLEAVLKHWEALKTNSTHALRNEFLQRAGKLYQEDNKHKLFIDRKTQDILLDRLPWNLQMVKLPWCENMLFVTW